MLYYEENCQLDFGAGQSKTLDPLFKEPTGMPKNIFAAESNISANQSGPSYTEVNALDKMFQQR